MTTELHKIKVSGSDESFTFTGKADNLMLSLHRVMEVTGYVSKTDIGRFHILVAYDRKVFIVGYSDETQCILEVPEFTSEGKGSAILQEPDKLKNLFKKRGEMKFTYSGKLQYSAVKGKFNGNVSCGIVGADQLPRIKQIIKSSDIDSEALCSNLLNSIREGVKRTNITDPWMDKSLLSYITFAKGKLIVSNYDDLHLAHYEVNVKTKSKDTFQLALPANMFNVVDRFLNDQEASFKMDARAFTVTGEGFSLSFPPVQTDLESFSVTQRYLTSVNSESHVCSFELDSKFKEAQDNLKSLTDNGERYTLSVKSKNITMSVDSDFGSASDGFSPKNLKLSTKDKIKVKIDPKILNDLLPLAAGDSYPFALHKRGGEVRLYVITQKDKEKGELLKLIGSITK